MEQAGFQQITEVEVQFTKQCADISAYREKAYSCLHLIPEEAHRRGIQRMEQDLKSGPLQCISRYSLVSSSKQASEFE